MKKNNQKKDSQLSAEKPNRRDQIIKLQLEELTKIKGGAGSRDNEIDGISCFWIGPPICEWA